MRKTLLSVILLTGFLLAACGSSQTGENVQTPGALDPVPAEYAGKTNPLGPQAAAAGGQVFQSNCAACHGPQGHGDGPAGASLDPAPKNLAELGKVATDDYLLWRISTGRPGTAMVPWKGVLSDEQIWQLVSFIRTLK